MRAAIAFALTGCALAACASPSGAPASATPVATLAQVAEEPSPSPRSTAEPAPAATPVPLPRCPSHERRIGAAELEALCVAGAELAIERGIDERAAATLVAQVRDDLASIQREFAWTMRGTPVIDVFATTASYTTGLVHAFGYSGATAAWVAENSVAFFEPDLRTIAVNWEAVRERRPIAAMRHELTHFVTLEACAPRCDLVPAWLNEGQAHLAEATIPGGEWRLARVRYEAASMVGTNTLMPLSRLVTQRQWNDIGSWAGYYKYQEAARATELLREDVGGDAPIGRLYERIRRGEDVARAYASLTGRSFDAFSRDLASRIADVGHGPAIVITAGPQADHGVGYLLYGFASDATLTIRLSHRRFVETEDIIVSPQGAHFSEIADRYPSGTYTLAALSGGTVIASATFDKRGGRPYY